MPAPFIAPFHRPLVTVSKYSLFRQLSFAVPALSKRHRISALQKGLYVPIVIVSPLLPRRSQWQGWPLCVSNHAEKRPGVRVAVYTSSLTLSARLDRSAYTDHRPCKKYMQTGKRASRTFLPALLYMKSADQRDIYL